jgi:hypothetical protein
MLAADIGNDHVVMAWNWSAYGPAMPLSKGIGV